jgi:ABC-type polysaccharide/polyol phosphate export permease
MTFYSLIKEKYYSLKAIHVLKKDLFYGAYLWKIWLSLAWYEFNSRYSRSYIGVGWSILTFALFCMAIILIFGEISMSNNSDFGPYVIVGFLIFSLISGIITSGVSVFTSNASWIKGQNMPYGVFIYKNIMLNIMTFILNLFATIIVLILFFKIEYSESQLILIPGFLIIILNAISINMLLGVLSLKYRDLPHLIQTLMRFSFFVTPVLWEVRGLEVLDRVASLNPLTYFLNIIRTPILHGYINQFDWIVVLIITFVLFFLSIFVYVTNRSKIAYLV